MTEASTPEVKKDNVTKGLVIALVVVFALAGIGYYAAKSGLSKEEVNASLNQFNAALADYGAKRGYEMKLAYDAMEASGGILNKKVTLTNPVFTLEPKNDSAFYRAMTIKTATVELNTTDAAFTDFDMVFPAPVTVINEEGSAEMAFSEPLNIQVNRDANEGGPVANYSGDLPAGLKINKADKTNAELAFGDNSSISGMLNLDAANYSHKTQLSNFTLKDAKESLSAVGVNVTLESGQQDAHVMRHQNIAVDQLKFEGPKSVLGALNIKADLESDTITTGIEDDAAEQQGEREVTINALSIENVDKAYAIRASGTVDLENNEMVPQGILKVTVDKPTEVISRMQRANVINPLIGNIALMTLPKIDPAWKDGAEELNFTLKRNIGEPLYIGSLTFEELTAQVLTGLLQQAAPAAGEDVPVVEGESSMQPQESPAVGADGKRPIPEGIDMDEVSRQIEDAMQNLDEVDRDDYNPGNIERPSDTKEAPQQ